MGKRENSTSSSSDRRQWERIFKALVEMLQSQQSDLETLADDRKILEQYIHQQHDHWTSICRSLESHISQLKKEEGKYQKVHGAKVDLMLDVKQREVLCYKEQYEYAEADLGDFRVCVETLMAEIVELMEKLKSGEAGRDRTAALGDSTHVEGSKGAALEGQIRKLKRSYKALSSKKEAEVSALLAEKEFFWHQLKKTENDYIAILKTKKIEVEHANETISKLHENLQDLQKCVNEKDEMIAELKATHELDMRMHNEEANGKITQLQLDKEELCSLSKEKDETITKLRSELAKLEMDVCHHTIRKSRVYKESSADAYMTTPSGSNPREGSRSKSTKQRSHKYRGVYGVSSGSRASAPVQGLVRCSSKRRTRSDSFVERPALFHSSFKNATSSTCRPCPLKDAAIQSFHCAQKSILGDRAIYFAQIDGM